MVAISNAEAPSLLFEEQPSAPTTPTTGLWRLYFKADGLYAVDDAGTEYGPFETAGAVLLADGSVALTATWAPGQTIDMADNLLDSPKLQDISEAQATPSSASGVLTLDYTTGPVFEVTLTENVTDVTISNPPASGDAGAVTILLKQDGTGGRTVAWGAEFKWAGGTAPTISSAASAVDVVTAFTTDGGTTWYAMVGGQDFS